MQRLVVCLLPFLLAACAAKQDTYFRGYILPTELDTKRTAKGDNLGSASPNVLKLGDTFVFNNPDESWTVTTITESFVTWSSPDGNYMKTAAVTFLPPVEWGGTGAVKDSGRRELSNLSISEQVDALAEGATYSFVEKRHNDRPPSVMTSNWSCTLGESAEILVPAGKTSAVPILCLQDGVDRLLMDYSPSLGYIVRHVLSTSNGSVVRELTGYQRSTKTDDKG